MYPVDVTADYGDGTRSRGLAALGAIFFLKALLAFPHALIVSVLGYAAALVAYIGYWVIAITGELPELFHTFPGRTLAWQVRTNGWMYSLRDEYPPFEWEPTGYGVELVVTDPPGSRSRLLGVLGIFLLKLVALVPHYVALAFVGLAAAFALWIAYVVILFTGSYPMGLFNFMLGVLRWTTRVGAWASSLTDKYPPFRLCS